MGLTWDNAPMPLADDLVALRLKRGYKSATALAKKARVHNETVANIEAGGKPNLRKLQQIAEALDGELDIHLIAREDASGVAQEISRSGTPPDTTGARLGVTPDVSPSSDTSPSTEEATEEALLARFRSIRQRSPGDIPTITRLLDALAAAPPQPAPASSPEVRRESHAASPKPERRRRRG